MQVFRAEAVHQIAEHAARQRPDPGLQQHVGGLFDAHGLHLLDRFVGQGGIALHDPGRDLGVTLPGGVLHYVPATLLGHLHGQAHGVVVVHVGDDALGPQRQDVVHPLLGRALWHVDHRMLTHLLGGPGDAATVVAVGGGGEGHRLLDGALDEIEGEILYRHPVFFTEQVGDGVDAPSILKALRPKRLDSSFTRMFFTPI